MRLIVPSERDRDRERERERERDGDAARERVVASSSLSPAERALRDSRRRRERFRRRAKAVAVLPSLVTLGNLIAGFAAIYFASKPFEETEAGALGWSSLTWAGMLIFFGMFFDAVDGYVARLTRSTSDLGAQLDSLADVVTFGVAPAYMTLQLVSKYYLERGDVVINPAHDDAFARVFWAIAAIYVCCTALRLARFNAEVVSPSVDEHLVFRGLPSPGAAGCVVSLILLHQHYLSHLEEEDWAARMTGLGMGFILLLCGLAMVSRLPYVHVINRYLRREATFQHLVLLAAALAIAVFYHEEAFALAFTAYALSAPARWAWKTWWRRMATARR